MVRSTRKALCAELLQNALDAAISAGRRAEVHLTVGSVEVDGFPGIAEYESAFDAANEERQLDREESTQDERNAIKRILDVLEADEAKVLFCRDNGTGLDAARMRAVLSEGNSNKPIKGAGSLGLGHLTAFAASDLRYVLYAGRRGEKHLISGHAIVATHPTGNGNTYGGAPTGIGLCRGAVQPQDRAIRICCPADAGERNRLHRGFRHGCGHSRLQPFPRGQTRKRLSMTSPAWRR